jgi:hypothetical protein
VTHELSKVAKRLLDEAAAGGRTRIAVERGIGSGPKGARIGYGAAEWLAALELIAVGRVRCLKQATHAHCARNGRSVRRCDMLLEIVQSASDTKKAVDALT